LPIQDLIVLSAAVIFFADRGEEKRLPLKHLYKEVEEELKSALENWSFRDKIDYNKFLHAIDELEFYGFFKVLKDKKSHEVLLTVDLEELDRELEKKKDERGQKREQTKPVEKQKEQL
jgi:hypothetical protein